MNSPTLKRLKKQIERKQRRNPILGEIQNIKMEMNEMNSRFDSMQDEMNETNSRFDIMQDEMNNRFDSMQDEMKKRFDGVSMKMKKIIENLGYLLEIQVREELSNADRSFDNVKEIVDMLNNIIKLEGGEMIISNLTDIELKEEFQKELNRLDTDKQLSKEDSKTKRFIEWMVHFNEKKNYSLYFIGRGEIDAIKIEFDKKNSLLMANVECKLSLRVIAFLQLFKLSFTIEMILRKSNYNGLSKLNSVVVCSNESPLLGRDQFLEYIFSDSEELKFPSKFQCTFGGIEHQFSVFTSPTGIKRKISNLMYHQSFGHQIDQPQEQVHVPPKEKIYDDNDIFKLTQEFNKKAGKLQNNTNVVDHGKNTNILNNTNVGDHGNNTNLGDHGNNTNLVDHVINPKVPNNKEVADHGNNDGVKKNRKRKRSKNKKKNKY
eukprot:TRINITY_DN110_c0_g1_i1.p1 TRINITY_DN110_c0_g1~~TRINITY_DN110_c0_g1_i1.p1  ORF type:complete len:432 (-),score=122.17 TRINITY_DN110_c0_g1_i1:62-1357(-)